MKSKYLIIGSGQLGQELINLLNNDVEYTYHTMDPFNRGAYLDITNFDLLEDHIIKTMPEIIINTAALTDVDKCETDRNMALKINGEAVKHIIRAARVLGSYVVQISTDYVFDGEKGLYKEDDLVNPINYYGLTKLIGESYALSYDDSLVIRTSGIFRHKGFIPFAFLRLMNEKEINAYKGYYSPISAKKLAEAIVKLTEKRKTGIINVAGERISRYDLTIEIAKHLNKNPIIKEVDNVPSWIAKRPYDSSLDISKAKTILDFDFYSLKENLKYVVIK
ncbi:MAG: SDR family oxidoreductase [Caldisphaera sp.]|uniref:SDR family oxidoreductase n=1 Tax=Caldisphaera sp. TaxID=2060322 RepID=UPI003D0AF2D5